jgi:hypothetical protein
MVRRIASLVLVSLVLAACGGDDKDAGGSEIAPSEITGVIVGMDAELLGEVDSFDVKDGDTVHTLYIDPEIDYEFPLGHLHEHLETAQPVRCAVEERDGKLYAQTIEDA